MTSKRQTRPSGKYYDALRWAVVRAPSLPIEAYLALAEPSSPAAVRWQTENDTSLPADPWVKLALTVGGGHLLEGLGNGSVEDPDARAKLLRYQIRMSARPTPFGLFAGVALVDVGAKTDVTIDNDKAVARARPDMGWLLSYVGSLEARPEIFRQLGLMAHPGAFEAAGRMFLSDPTPLKDTSHAPVVSVRATSAVQLVMSRARADYVPYSQLAQELAGLPGADPDKVARVLVDLWKQGLLLSNLRPPVTTANPAEYVVGRLLSLPAPPSEVTRLRSLIDAMADWSRLDAIAATEAWPALDAAARALHATDAPKDATLEADLALSIGNAVVNWEIAKEAADAAELLLQLTPFPRGIAYLSGYRAAFEARYGHDRAVPLLELVDPNFGLGPPGNHAGAGVDPQRWSARSEAVEAIALQAMKDRRLSVQLDDKTVSRLTTWEMNSDALPLSLDVCLFVIASSEAAIDAGDFRVVAGPNVGAREAGSYLGRFSDLLGSRASEALSEIARREEIHVEGATWAELAYLPRRLRSANVVVRPAVRHHEIAIGVAAGVSPDRTIPLDELLVTIRDGRFRLQWRRDDTEVIVRGSHMLNSMLAPGVCRFLDDVADDGVAQLMGFDWGPVAGYAFLPRLEVGRIVVSQARWRITRMMRDAELPPDDTKFHRRLYAFRERWNAPRYVYLTTGDNRLLLDLDAPAQANVLRNELAKIERYGAILLQEALPGPDHAWVKGVDGYYLAELVVPIVRRPHAETRPTKPAARPEDDKRTQSASPLARMRPPGSDWLFVKLYYPPTFEEELLAGPVREFCNEICAAGISSGWFYVRYADPDAHIRLRFRGDPQRLMSKLVPEVCAWCADLMAQGLSQRFSFDTYDRDRALRRTCRRGGIRSALQRGQPSGRRLARRDRATPELDRELLTIASIDDFLSSVGLEQAQRLAWYQGRVTFRHPSGDTFRRRKTLLRNLLGAADGVASLPGGEKLVRIFARRRRSIEPVAARLVELEKRGELDKPRDRILHSIVHLHCNRLNATTQR